MLLEEYNIRAGGIYMSDISSKELLQKIKSLTDQLSQVNNDFINDEICSVETNLKTLADIEREIETYKKLALANDIINCESDDQFLNVVGMILLQRGSIHSIMGDKEENMIDRLVKIVNAHNKTNFFISNAKLFDGIGVSFDLKKTNTPLSFKITIVCPFVSRKSTITLPMARSDKKYNSGLIDTELDIESIILNKNMAANLSRSLELLEKNLKTFKFRIPNETLHNVNGKNYRCAVFATSNEAREFIKDAEEMYDQLWTIIHHDKEYGNIYVSNEEI